MAFFKERFPLWLFLTHGYTAFWHVTLYWLKWSDRPLIPSRIFNLGKVLHNIMHSTFGIAQWVCFENVFSFLWATGRLQYLSDSDAASTWSGLAIFIIGLVAVPLWRDGARCMNAFLSFLTLCSPLLFFPPSAPLQAVVQIRPFTAPSQHRHRAFCWTVHAPC
jgi:hypothetical protein